MIKKKVSMLGAYAVGKTSLVRRFVKGIFSEKYQTTIGVKIDKREIDGLSAPMTMMLWDLHGEDELQKVRLSYIKGSAGYFLVVDGTRAHSLVTALNLHEAAQDVLGPVPFTMLINKSDLRDEWDIDPDAIAGLVERGFDIVETSAKSGVAVEAAFTELARRLQEPGA